MTEPFAGLVQDIRARSLHPEQPRAYGTVAVSEIIPEKINWLWQDRIPFGMVTILAGAPGTGKSTILYDLAARSSREGRTVLICTAEDHLAAVVRPRLEAAGANLTRIHVLTEAMTLPDDVAHLEDHAARLGASLLTIDPVVAFIGDGVNTHRDHHIRRVFAPLGALAERQQLGCGVVLHTNKAAGADPMLRISGSVGFTGAARSVLLAAEDPSDDARRILAVVKSNLASFPPPLAYKIVGAELDGGITTSAIQWLGEAPDVDVQQLLAGRDPEERGATQDAMEFLRETGLLDVARPVHEVEAEAKALGHAERTLRRARHLLKIPAWKEGFPGTWYWGPRSEHDPATRSGHPKLGHLAESGPPAETPPEPPDVAKWPGSGADGDEHTLTQPGHPHPVQVVQVGDDLQEQGSPTLNLDNATGLGEDEPEPGWMQIQREAGEVPETDEAAALERRRLGGPSEALVRRVRAETGGAA